MSRLCMERLGIRRLHNVIGGSMGGMQALQWAVTHPDKVKSAAVICSHGKIVTPGYSLQLGRTKCHI